MPTIPLYDTSAPPDGYHRVTAPGGYEWWSIIAQGARVKIDFIEGNPFDVAYRSAYRRYVAHPTRVVPPAPRDYPSVSARLADNGAHHVFGPPPAKGSFRYVQQPRALAIGESSILWKSDRILVITLRLTTADRRAALDGELTLDLIEPAVAEAGEVRGRGRLTGLLRDTSRDVVHRIEDEAHYAHTFSVRPMWQR
jgi:hypothetical protein